MNQSVKKDYSAEIAEFLANGGEIKPAVNSSNPMSYAQTNTFLFSSPSKESASEVNKNNSHKNAIIRERASNAGKKSYVTVTPCGSCATSERSVRSNACLECDRRRFRLKTGANEKTMTAVAGYLVAENKTFTCTIFGKKYILKAELVNE